MGYSKIMPNQPFGRGKPKVLGAPILTNTEHKCVCIYLSGNYGKKRENYVLYNEGSIILLAVVVSVVSFNLADVFSVV
jgi:hypothetical protein